MSLLGILSLSGGSYNLEDFAIYSSSGGLEISNYQGGVANLGWGRFSQGGVMIIHQNRNQF